MKKDTDFIIKDIAKQTPDYEGMKAWLIENNFPVESCNYDALMNGDEPYTESEIADLEYEAQGWQNEIARLDG